MKKFILFNIIFEDNTCFVGGDYFNTKWINIPNKKIKRVFYTLPDGNRLCLEGYNKYYQMIEVAHDIYGKKKSGKRIEFGYIMGRRKGLVIIYKIALFKNSDHNIGDIKREVFKENSEKIRKLNPDGWK